MRQLYGEAGLDQPTLGENERGEIVFSVTIPISTPPTPRPLFFLPAFHSHSLHNMLLSTLPQWPGLAWLSQRNWPRIHGK